VSEKEEKDHALPNTRCWIAF